MAELPAGLRPERKAHGADALLDTSLALSGRYVHMDITRLACVVCVIVNEFNKRFAENNVLFSQNWVLPLLWVVCGLCFGMSQRPLWQYVGRLATYAGIGTLANFFAWWQREQAMNEIDQGNMAHFWDMVAQMQFVISLILICIFLAPLKTYLRHVAEAGAATERLDPESRGPEEPMGRDGFIRGIFVSLGGVLGIIIVFTCLEPSAQWLIASVFEKGAAPLGLDTNRGNEDHMRRITRAAQSLSLYLAIMASGLWIVYTFLELFPFKSMVAWLLLANFYGYMLIFDGSSSAHFFHGLYLAMVAITALNLGLYGRRQIGSLLLRYWMAACFLITFMWRPGLTMETLEPPTAVVDRERYIMIEAVLVSAWLCAGQLLFDTKIYTEDQLTWLNDWVLIAFLSFHAVLWIFGLHLGLAMLLCIGPVCYLAK